jgi:hypothetical protein
VEHPHFAIRRFPPALIFALFFFTLLALHAPLLRLPYFWDEAGYYVPAAHDLLMTGSLIPHSTPSNAHPPLVMAWLALWWKLAGFAPLVTRTAMLMVAAFALLGVFRLARSVANFEVACASTMCTGLYPVFFAQSSLAQVDLAAAGLIFWGLLAYIESRTWSTITWFSLAGMAKETAVLVPLALFGWELARLVLVRMGRGEILGPTKWDVRRVLLLLFPVVPLALWYAYHYSRMGFVFGNAEFFRYNVQATLHPLRILLALLLRLWQVFGYMNLYLLTAAGVMAMCRPPVRTADGERPRMALDTQFAFLAVAGVYVLAMAIIGGAELARYMLPIIPLTIIIFVSTLWRRVQFWRGVVAIVVCGFVIGLFVNPPHGFSIEDNLAYRDYIVLHQHAERFLEARYPMARVLTAWPANDEIARPALGYVSRPMRAVRIEDFRMEELLSAAELRSGFDVALVFSTKYEPTHTLLENWQWWQKTKTRYFDYHRDVPPQAAAQILGGEIVYSETRKGQWIAVIELQRVMDARLSQP